MKQENCSLLSHNTFGIDVKAACLLEYSSVDELRELKHAAKRQKKRMS